MKMHKEEYESMYRSESTLWWYQSLHEVVLSRLSKIIRKKGQILDVGCGTGKMMEKLITAGYKVDGLDLSETAIAFTKKRKISSVKKASATAIPYPDDSYVAVVMLDVLPFIETKNVPAVIAEIHRVLKKNGYCIIHAAAYEWLWSDQDEICNTQHRYTKQEVQSLFPPKKWIHLFFSYRLFLLFLPIVLVKLFKHYKRLFMRSQAISDTQVLPAALNSLFKSIMTWEDAALGRVSYPFGSSIIGILQKK